MKNIIVKEMVLEVYAGAHINDCIRDALILAITENRTVTFEFNEKEIYRIDPIDIIKYIYQINTNTALSA